MQDAKRQAWKYEHWTKLLKEYLASPQGTCKNGETHTWSVHVLIIVEVMNIVHWAWYLAARLQWIPISNWVATGTTLMSYKEVLCSFFYTLCRVTVLISSISTYRQHGISSTAHIYTNPGQWVCPFNIDPVYVVSYPENLLHIVVIAGSTVLLPAFFVFPVTALLPILHQCFCPISWWCQDGDHTSADFNLTGNFISRNS